MRLATFGSGHRVPGRRKAPPLFAARVSLPCSGYPSISPLCPLNFQLSTVNSGSSTQSPCFHNLPHSSTSSHNSPLCFHNLTNSFSRKLFPLITIQIARGCHPVADQLSKLVHEPRTSNSISANLLDQLLTSSFRHCLLPSAYCLLFLLLRLAQFARIASENPLVAPGGPALDSGCRGPR